MLERGVYRDQTRGRLLIEGGGTRSKKLPVSSFCLERDVSIRQFLERDRAAHEQRNVVAWGVAGLFRPVDW